MIDDSHEWKDRLRRGRAVLRRKLREAEANPARATVAYVEVEAFAFLAGYIVRKLSEANKLSDELEAAAMDVVSYPSRPEHPLDFLNAHRFDRAYDFGAPTSRAIKLRQLCNQLVHSFVFVPTSDENGMGWTGFFLNSDRTKSKELLFIARDDFDLLVDEVIRDDVVTMHLDRVRGVVKKSRVGESDPPPKIPLNVAGHS